MDFRNFLEKLARFVRGHFENVGDVFPAKSSVERFTIVTPSAARFARHVDIAEKVHVDFDQHIALAGFATTAGNVETESAGSYPRVRESGSWVNKSRIGPKTPM